MIQVCHHALVWMIQACHHALVWMIQACQHAPQTNAQGLVFAPSSLREGDHAMDVCHCVVTLWYVNSAWIYRLPLMIQ